MSITQHSSIFSLSLLFLFIVLSFFHFQLSPCPTPSRTLHPNPSLPILNSTNDFAAHQPRIAAPHRHTYIMRFLEYKGAKQHRVYLESNLRFGGWEWIERRNPTAKYPTDFGLVSIEDSVKEELTEEIQKLGLAKVVNVDMGYVRGLLKEDDKEKGKVGAFVDGKKRLRKIFTLTSFGEGGHCIQQGISGVKWLSFKT